MHLLQATLRKKFFPPVVIHIFFAVVVLLEGISFAAHLDTKTKKEKPYALIFGTVWSPDAHPVYGVKVKIRRAEDKKARWEMYSNHLGEFEQRVPAGKADYVVWADIKPSKKAKSGIQGNHGEVPEVKVHIEYDERVDTGLHLTE